ncbi:hypothetical protein CHGG_09741 [Chaetomium globosum CBS 148.51]|uniref:Succinyl-CoA:3-ketoacid-coenzyme A transferase n=1 Tax=Chaetomium globosum (strain ATCC 6205 / CBS 148.51 / DSM 1962 / NBRC 6347 / NRRL 1970) TaxID=306901 RepID=Q2GQL3_CHAGB|nr:uncharacterized protein CHGG_09741 [Chaetomium globosum CBS 148.51]EAQ83337.1 hypothetical protein CHGG_09741 [Chaetomium globosum CBS 148.51]
MPSTAMCMRTLRAYAKYGQNHAALFARSFSATARRRDINKVYPSAAEAIKDMKPNSTLLCGGFGLCGVPDTLIDEVLKKPELKGITAVSNNAGTDNSGLGKLLRTKQIKKMIASYIGENKTFESMYLTGEVELELTPQGTLAERCAAGGKGIPAFYTPAAFGTVVQTGELPLRNKPDGTPDQFSYPKDVKVFNGKSYLLEHSIAGDYAFVKAYKADRLGNCQFRLAANNFNGAMGRNAKMTIVEAEHIVEPGEIPARGGPPARHLRQARYPRAQPEKNIEKYTWSKDPAEAAEDPKCRRGAGHGRHQGQARAHRQARGQGVQERHEDADLINAGKETVTLKPGASVFGSEESFGMIRSGRINLTILGAMQVSAVGDLAQLDVAGQGQGTCVSRILTELGVFDVDFAKGLTLIEIADGVTVDEIKAKTEAPFKVADDLKPML